MMKLKHITLGIGCLLVLMSQHACIDDRGSSPYASVDEMMSVRIAEMNDTTVEIMSTLRISPKISGLEEGREYSYLWYAANSVTAGLAPTRDTLGRTPDLTFNVNYESGSYNLVFEVRDVKHNIYARTQLLMTVASNFAHGWYLLKDEAGKTDFDFVQPDGILQSNVLQALGMEPLNGKPKKLGYQSQRYYHEITNPDGTVATLVNKKAMYVLSEKDMRIFNADNMSVFKPSFDECFYEAPQERRPQNIHIAGGDVYLINAGKMHSIYGMSSNIGKFPYAKTGTYELHDDIVGSTLFGDITVWDKASRTFFATSSSGAVLNKFSEQSDVHAPVTISPSDMPVDVIRFLKRADYPVTAYAVMKSPNKEEYYLADMKPSGYPFVSFDTLPAQCRMPKADVMAAHGVASCIYFGIGSELSVYNHRTAISDRESLIKTFPGESISFIGNIRSTNRNDQFNNLVVVTNSATGWKLYRFNLVGETFEIVPEPIKVYSGQGVATFAIFRI